MIEEAEFHEALATVNETPCAFAKAVLNAQFGCHCSLRIWLADRESASCTCPSRQTDCVTALQILRLEAAPLLGANPTLQHFPHNLEVRLQVGGLVGIQTALLPTAGPSVSDITGLLQQARQQWGAWEHWPYLDILKAILQQPGRRLRR